MSTLDDGLYFLNLAADPSKVDARITRLDLFPQSPIHADELDFTLPTTMPIPELQEVVLVKDGSHIFHGHVTERTDNKNYWSAKCRSVQWLLDWRYIPDFTYAKDTLLDDILASGDPTSTNIGILAWINGLIPNGKWSAYSATVAKLADGGEKSCFGTKNLYASTSYPNGGTVDACDGVHALSSHALPPGANQYTRDINDLYVRLGDGSYAPNAFLVLAKDWQDTGIRLGTIDIGTKKTNIPFSIPGKASSSLNTFFDNLGSEREFLSKPDFKIYLNLASEISRGSATHPTKRFINDTNCKVRLVSQKTPNLQGVIGINSSNVWQPIQSAIDLSVRDPQLFQIYDGMGLGCSDMKLKVAALLAQNDISLEIATNEIDLHQRIGDWIYVYRAELGAYNLRVQKVHFVPDPTLTAGQMVLTVGKTPFLASTTFGQYFRKSIDAKQEPLQINTLTNGAGTFVIYDHNALDELRVFYKEILNAPSDGSPITLGTMIDLSINGKVVPPGRMRATDGGEIKVDISDYITKSSSTDSTNTVLRNLYLGTGWTSQSSSIEQYLAHAMIT
jgi:hypothetical protein